MGVILQSNSIKIDNYYTIEFDQHNCILVFKQKFYNEKTEKDSVRERKTYHTNVKAALKAYMEKALEQAKGIDDLIYQIEQLEEMIDKLPKEFEEFYKKVQNG